MTTKINLEGLASKASVANTAARWFDAGEPQLRSFAAADRDHIAATSPAVTLALIARIRELEAAMMRAGHAFAGILPAPDVQQFIALIERGAVIA